MSGKTENRNYFRDNRLLVQNTLLELEFLKPLTEADTTLRINETKASVGDLNELIVKDVPVSDSIRPKSWFVNPEYDKIPLLCRPAGVKAVDGILITLSDLALTFFLIELKTSVKAQGNSGLLAIQKKFEDTIGRLRLFLPIYIFNSDYNNISIEFRGLVFYNRADLEVEIQENPEFASEEIVRIYQNRQPSMFIDDPLKGNNKIDILFFQNPDSQKEQFLVKFAQFFRDNNREQGKLNSILYADRTCPIHKTLPEF